MKKQILIIALCSLALIFYSVFRTNQSGQKAQAQSSVGAESKKIFVDSSAKENQFGRTGSSTDYQAVVKPSLIIEKLREKKNTTPTFSSEQLVAYANELLESGGYDFTFDWEPKGKVNEENLRKLNSENLFEYQFTEINGKKRKFQFINGDFGHPCFSVIDVPFNKVNEQTMTIVSNDEKIELKRPKDFGTEEFVLVNKSKKPIRKWKTPIDAMPVGISEDGRKVYFESWQFYQDQTDGYKESPINLAIEISDDGRLKVVDSSEIKSDKGTVIDYDKKYTEIQYVKYKVGGKEFIVKYSAPCT